MFLAIGSGVFIASHGGWFGSGWLFAKISLVLGLAALHGVHAGQLRRRLMAVPQKVDGDAKRGLGLVVVAVAAIVTLVVFKPF